MEKFNDAYRNQINIAILGPTSAGKSTLLNSIFVNTYSDMKKKRTTMTPQVYYESKNKNSSVAKEIKIKNREINKKIISKTENSQTLTEEDIKECIYFVPKISNLVTLMKEVYLTVYDIPGLDDPRTDIYFKYMQNNFYKFDIIIFVIDIDCALNTQDQIKILVEILTNIKKNKELYNINTTLMVLTNKCDDLQFDKEKNKYKFLDGELDEMFQQTKLTIEQKVEEIYEDTEYYIHPLSAEDSYIYRMYEKNPSYELDIKHINKFGFNEYGKSRWNRLKDSAKNTKVKELLSKMNICENLKHSGFYGFQKCLEKMLTKKKQYIYIQNHLIYGLKLINKNNTIDITEDINQFYLYFKRFSELNQYYSKELDKKYANLNIFNNHINKYLEGYKLNIIDKYISGNDKTGYYPINEAHIVQIDQMHNIFKELYRMFNGHCPIITSYNNKIISTLNNYYSNQINNKSKSISDTVSYLYKLFVNKFKITKELIGNIFSNNDMKQKSPSEIISYLTDLEKKKLISLKDKINYLNTLLINIYTDLSNATATLTRFTDVQKKGMYCYYINLIWNNFVTGNLDLCFIGNFKDSINTLVFYSKKNNKHFINNEYKSIEELDTMLDLELYLISLYGEFYNITFNSIIFNKFNPELNMIKKSDTKINTYATVLTNSEELNSGNLSDDLDAELGLTEEV